MTGTGTMATCMLAAAALSAASPSVAADSIVITHAGSQPGAAGSSDNFVGSVRVEDRFKATAPATVVGATVIFSPGARTAWHSHPLGQTLIVSDGLGWVQMWGGKIQEIHPGDVVWIPPNVKHWHGATADAGMTHIAFSETVEGKSVDWMEQVSDAQYNDHTR